MPGFLPFRGSLMLDLVCVAMVAVLIGLGISIYLVRYRKLFHVHRTIQLVLALVLGIAIVAFEVDLRWFTDWRALARPSSFHESGWVDRALWIHLAFAIPTPFVWIAVIVSAVRRFGQHPRDADYWRRHRWYGRLSAALMCATAVTGWTFYWIAFVA